MAEGVTTRGGVPFLRSRPVACFTPRRRARGPPRDRRVVGVRRWASGRGLRGGVRRATAARRTASGVASGLDALRLGLLALGIEARRRGRSSRRTTFVATFEAVVAGGRDARCPSTSRDRDYCLDLDAVERCARRRGRGSLLPVHLYGQMADMRRARARSPRDTGSTIVEDACQAHGADAGRRARRRGRRRGGVQLLPGQEPRGVRRRRRARHRRRELAAHVRALREHGQRGSTSTSVVGYTARLDTIQALVLLAQAAAPRRLERRAPARAAALLRDALAGVGDLALPPVADRQRARSGTSTSSGPPTRAASPRSSRERGIGTGRHYPEPPHLSQAYAHLGLRGAARSRSPRRSPASALSLPIFPGITRGAARAVVAARVRDFFARWLTRPANDAPLPPDRRRRVRRGRRRPLVHEPLRLPDRRQHAHRDRSSRSSAAPSIGADCKIQSHTFICDGVEIEDEVFVGHGVDVRQRQVPARDDRRRARCRRRRTGSCSRRSSSAARRSAPAPSPRRRADRRGSARRRRRGRHAGRVGRFHGRRRPRTIGACTHGHGAT